MVPEKQRRWSCLFSFFAILVSQPSWGAEDGPLSLSWSNEMLSIRGSHLCGGAISVHYVEAFCRPGSTRLDWKETVIPHRTRLVEASADHRLIRLRSELDDGVVVDHEIRAGQSEVDFRVVATNHGTAESQAHWAQPCIRVDRFTGVKPEPNSEAYLPRCFQGVIVCLHSDFRIGGLKPGQTKTIRGKIYLMPADVDGLLARYRTGFPEHHRQLPTGHDGSRPRKLIEFGWDEPDLDFLLRNRAIMARSPFDGCVFHVNSSVAGKQPESLTWLGWGAREFKPAEFPGAFKALAASRIVIDPTRKAFDHNFLRFNVTPGKLDWFDDHRVVVANARLAGSFARQASCDGILLDTEQYEGQLFDYSKQRDAARRSWLEYAFQARRRGKEVMAAMQEDFPDLTVMLTFGPSLLCIHAPDVGVPREIHSYGLLVPFVDGLIDAAKGKTRIVDGFEQSYGYRQAASFEKARELITNQAAPQMGNPTAYRRLISAGFGLWLDYDWRKRGWKPDKPESNYFSPDRFHDALCAALARSDEYVWIYTEKPRWWSNEGKPVELPDAYVQSIRRAREKYCKD